MGGFTTNPIFVGAAAAALSLLLTYAVREVAIKRGIVAKPKTDRWHKRPTAMLGGVGIMAATVIAYLAFVPKTEGSLVVMGGAVLLFFVGLVDDLLNIRPYQKLIGQLAGAGILVLSGLTLPLTGNALIDIWITVFWVIGITNAINLLDNMDGLAAGIAAIAAFSLSLNFASNGLTNELLLTAALIGALVGFLVYNFNPATIFMGDCGSMFIGFLLSGAVLLNQVGGRSRGIVPILAVPVLILLVPIFDTTFVTVIRKLWGRKASQGGRDHTSHRLVALGLTERNAVLMLYAFAVAAGALALFVGQIGRLRGLAMIGAFSVVLVIIGVYLSRVKVYEGEDEESAVKDKAVFAFLLDLTYKRRIFEVFLDAFLIMLAYYSAYALVVRNLEGSTAWPLFLTTLPLVILLKLSAFLVMGVYRGVWRYTGLSDLVTIGKGVVLGSVLSVLAILLLYRFFGFSRTVFMLDAILLFVAVAGSRIGFRLIRQIIPIPASEDSNRVLIFGAGDGGEMVLRELNNNPQWKLAAVGFVDDDPRKVNKKIHGLTVFDGAASLTELCRREKVSELLISARNMTPERLREIRDACDLAEVAVKKAEMRIEPLEKI
ncbi:MAG: glycosyl transferase [Acidobacteriota bacterium]|nr:MAG: glycosyl transferase [Acidobacteriota bacterium]